MPRRKQGHSKESATGGYLKKKTDPGIVLIQNESFKHLPTSNDLVFKLKKTVSSIIPLPTSNEKIEREHIEASKSLSDNNMVSQHEINNNLIKPVQDENKVTQNEIENFCGAEGHGNESLGKHSVLDSLETAVVLSLSVKNPLSVVSMYNENVTVTPSLHKSVIINSRNTSPSKVIISNRLIYTTVTSPHCNNSTDNLDSVNKNALEAEAQNAEMSGVTPTVTSNERHWNRTESQQMNYRISASENRSNHSKDAAGPVLEQNCQLPSSVYGTPASSIEKVLTGLQVPEKDIQSNNLGTVGKISFLQEILGKKSVKVSISESVSSSLDDKNILQRVKPNANDSVMSSVRHLHFPTENKDQNRTDSTSQSKLKLHIPDGLSNDDSNSSIISTESLKTSKFPKITSPQILEQHISKIISENAAIVETLDPMWSRRYFKQTSQTNTLSNEGDLKKTSGKVCRSSEGKNVLFNSFDGSNKSKLHSALLGESEGEVLNSTQNVSNSSPSGSSSKERNFSEFSNLLTTVPSVSMYSKIVCSVSEDELKGSAIKSLLSLKQGKYSKHKKAFCFDKDIHSQHPQNPEGSIIKDLLLKSKSQEELKLESDIEDKSSLYSSFISSDVVNDLNNGSEKQISLFKCSQCSSEFSNKYNLDIHLNFCNSANPLLSLRDSTEKFRFKEISAQSKPLSPLDFQYKIKKQSWEESSKNDSTSENMNDGIGQILKQQLLMPRSPPVKRRKVSDSLFAGSYIMEQSINNSKNDNNGFPTKFFSNMDIPPHRARSQSVHLFGGEVRVLDGLKTKKIKIKTTLPGAFSMFTNKVSNNLKKLKPSDDLEIEKDTSSLPGVIVNIAQPVHNSGGTVHVPSRVLTSSPVVAISSDFSDSIPDYTNMETLPIFNFSKNSHQSELFKPPSDHKEPTVQNLSYPYDFLPGPDSKTFTIPKQDSIFKINDFMPGSSVDEISPANLKVTLSPCNKPFYSPIFSSGEKSFESPAAAQPKENTIPSHPIVPTVLFTPSSPTMPSTDNDITLQTVTSISESSNKKFLAPARPTSLPLKKKPFTMVSSTLVSPETPRPKKTCLQLYLGGHAYTNIGLKCSTRSTYCCIYRPQPMFVPQETNPKLSMYSNWQVVPAKEELFGLTPGQMISLYCSKQRKEMQPITVNAKLGEPLIFTHSSYWTYRSQDQEQSKGSSSCSEANLDRLKDLQSPSENAQDLIQGENSHSESVSSFGNKPDIIIHSADDSSLHVDTENTCSDGDLNNSNDDDEDDDDCQDDGTESLTDSSQPQPPKRVKIFEGGFKSNEDYTYVRGRGRGKYVCEECGIRCKKPSMLKKHIRTHTDLRPYKCRHCSFAFKTKGNLTKHMKSKAHHKKCTELGIIPVPTTTDDSQIDEEALAKQEQIEKKKTQFSDGEDADDDEDEDSDESEDECESDTSSMISSDQKNRMLTNGHSKKSDSQEKLNMDSFDEAIKGNENVSQHALEQEAVKSLLNLSALGEPSQWSTSTGNLTDVTSSGETEDGSLAMRPEQSFLSASQLSSHNMLASNSISSRSKNMSDQWLSTDTLGHRPRSYSADVPQSSGKDSLAKYKFLKQVNINSPLTTPEDDTEFGGREPYTRRYSISVAREARKPQVLNPLEWVRPQKWLEGETSDQPMDLSITRDLGKYKSLYTAGIPNSLMNMVTQEENAPESDLSSSIDVFGESYQKLPVLSPQVLADYETSCDNISTEASLLPLTDEQATFASSTSRPLYFVQDIPTSDNISNQKEADVSEDPPSPDITDYAVCSPVSPPMLEDSSYYYSQKNASQAAANPEDVSSSSRCRAEFIVPSSSSSGMEEGKCVCRICNKMFERSSHLRLHVNIHYFERPFRCDSCAVSFRTKGHLQKHKRSVSHYNKVNMNLTFGTPTVDNPRPFKCADCKIAFRIHGHLAKHLRSKMHIMKLECLGKLPFGMYAEMERSGVSLNEIDTTDCNNSLESLQVLARNLYQRDPRRMRWQGPEQISDTGCVIPAAPVATTLIDSMLPISESLTASFDTACAPIVAPVSTLANSLQPSDNEEVKQELLERDALRFTSVFSESDCAVLPLSRYIASYPATTPNQETIQHIEVSSESDSVASLNRSGTCHICGRFCKDTKRLQIHLYSEHPNWDSSSVNEVTSSNSSISSVSNSQELVCDLCGRQFPNQKTLQQHLLTHAQLRPFVCEFCDAGFTSSSSLVAHKETHQKNSSATSNT